MNFCIYPAGAWGTAIALHLDRLGHTVTLVPFEMEEALEITSSRENKRFLPGYVLPGTLQISLELRPALMEADVCVIGSPSQYLRQVCRKLKAESSQAWALKDIVLLTKGLEEGTNMSPVDVVAEELPHLRCSALSGPTFASQVAAGKPSAIVLASTAPADELRRLQAELSGPSFRVYSSSDVKGVCLGGSIKNVYAIAAGCCDGLNLGDNAKAALLTRSLAEMIRVGRSLGGQTETFYGLTGFGDLMLTCNGRESRNRTFGELLARGDSIKRLLDEKGMTVEGYRSCACFASVCDEKGIDAPILTQINQVLFKGKNPAEALADLMKRDLKPEHPAVG